MNVTLEDFNSFFPFIVEDDMFEDLLPSAVAYIESITANRSTTATGYKAERVKYAVCAVLREMAAQNAAKGEGGTRVVSVSNDGYSENYGAYANAAQEEAALRSIAFRYLSGTGLVSAL